MQRRKLNKTRWQKFKDFWNFDPLAAGQNAALFESMATMLVAGIDIKSILEQLFAEARSKHIKAVIEDLLMEVENGTPLWRVLEYHKMVPSHYLALIRSGEQSGNLLRNLEIVVAQMEQDREYQNQIRSVSLYPAIIISVFTIVIFGLLTFVLPRVSAVYHSLHVDLPLITRLVLGIGDFIGANLLVIVSAFFVTLLGGGYSFFFNGLTKKAFIQFGFVLPVIGRIIQEIEIAKFCNLLAQLLKSGIGLHEAFALLQNSSQLHAYSHFYKFAGYYLERGYNLGLILNSYERINKIIPFYPRQLIVSGEKLQQLVPSLERLAKIYAKKNEQSLKEMHTIFEPVFLMFIWTLVITFAIAMILPIYSVLGSVSDLSQSGQVEQQQATLDSSGRSLNLNTNIDTLRDSSK